MKKWLVYAIAFISFYPAVAFSNNIVMPDHPRLLIKGNEIAAIKQRMNNPVFNKIRAAFTEQKNYITKGFSEDGIPNDAIRQKMEALALSYLLDTVNEKASGTEAVKLANSYLSSIKSAKGYHPNAQAYAASFGAAMVYDWCYSLMSKEDKALLLENMKRVCCVAEYCLFKNTPKQYLTGHYGEEAPSVFMAIGIAAYNEDPSIFEFIYKEQVQSFAPSRNPWYKSGAHHQGSQYIHVRYGNEILQAFILDKLGLNPYDKAISTLTYRDIYDQIPQEKDMDGIPEGDCHNHLTMGSFYMTFIPLSASLSKDPYLQSYATMNLNKITDLSTRAFLFYNPDIKEISADSLPLSRFFPSPSGLMFARTKWDLKKKGYDSKAMVVMMNMREYNAKNHVHLDVGNFDIYYKGHLALDAGIYQGSDDNNGWGKLNYVNYYTRTVAHNSLLILDPNEPTPYEGHSKKAESRDGGQFSFKNFAWDSSQQMFAAGKPAQILAEDIAPGKEPDYTYLKGDMTTIYNVPSNVAVYPAKADTVRRSFVFLNFKSDKVPGALIVLDKVVSTNPSFKKSWLLHGQNEPLVQNGAIVFTSTNEGRNGKLLDNVLIPELNNQQIEKIGGVGKEYWVDGKNWGTVTQEDAGRWRIELSPKQASKSDNFLNVLQVMDAEPSPTPEKVVKVYSTKREYVAIAISDRIVAERLNLVVMKDTIDFTIGDKDKEYKVLVTDLKKGYWLLNYGKKQLYKMVSDNTGTVYFNSKGGHFVLTYRGSMK